MNGVEVVFEILKYVLPAAVTVVMALVASHFTSLQKRLEHAEASRTELLERMHGLELRQTADRSQAQVDIRTAVAEVIERIANRYVPMASYLSSQAGVEKRLDTMDGKMDRVEAKLDKMAEGRA